MTMNRRKFHKILSASAVWAGAGFAWPKYLAESDSGQSLVVNACSKELIRENHDLKKEKAAKFLDEAMMRITETRNRVDAWRRFFSPKEKVGIKLSCLPGRPLSSTPGLVMAIVDGLLSAGIPGKNIFVWERSNRELRHAGFAITQNGINIFGTDHIANGGYSDQVEISGSVGTCFSRIVENVDALISVPVLKDHDIAGISISLKNFFGAIYNPNKFHQNRCNPYVADLCQHPFIKNKLRLTVCDASRVQVHNGPAFYPRYAWEYGGILVSIDPVALDFVGWQIIEKKRRELGLKSLKESGREPDYILTAGKLGLGNARNDWIQKVDI